MPRMNARVLALFLMMLLIAVSAGNGLCAKTININTATEQQLATLPGIGPVIAKRIVDYRAKKPFKKPEDIMNVKGIGLKVFQKIKPFIKV